MLGVYQFSSVCELSEAFSAVLGIAFLGLENLCSVFGNGISGFKKSLLAY
jgi:hypothetical protein